jgi:hypothetical protein
MPETPVKRLFPGVSDRFRHRHIIQQAGFKKPIRTVLQGLPLTVLYETIWNCRQLAEPFIDGPVGF